MEIQKKISPRNVAYRLGHVAIRVQDMSRAKAFYQFLGLLITWDAPDWAYLQLPGSDGGIALLSPEYKSAGPHFAFHFSSRKEVEDIHTRLLQKGYEIGSIHDHRDGTASFYLQDFEGNWLEMLYEPSNRY
uniref:Possible ring-cleaving dioxygenase n=1 Tax=Paulinella chromatophora TaxID=39717 RepID=B1X579_PAUCH|nr:possible ring-cleaving dioxygenase [Paulinella chromatophora]ACB43098.1 possible ring-cleaving dioxygenase [Paulinella chromatophora]